MKKILFFMLFLGVLGVIISGCVENPPKEKVEIEMFDSIVQVNSTPILIYASLKKPLDGKKITFYLDGELIGSDITKKGKVVFVLNKTLSVGNHTLMAFFEGDENYSNSSITKILSVVKIGSKLTTLNYKIYFKENLSVDALLISGLNAMSGETVKFYLGSELKGSNITNEEGKASLFLGNLKPGNYTLTVRFEGNEIYSESSDSKNIEVTEKIPTVIKGYDSIEENGTAWTVLNAALLDYKGNFVKGKKISFYYGKNLIGENITAEGNASIYFNIKNLSLGSHLIVLRFEGDENYYGSTSDALVTIKKEFEISGVKIYTEIPLEELASKKISIMTDSSDLARYCADEIENNNGTYILNIIKDKDNNIVLKAGIAQIGIKESDYGMPSCHIFYCLKNNIKCNNLDEIFISLGKMENFSIILDSQIKHKASNGYLELLKALGYIQQYLYSNGKMMYIKPYVMENRKCTLKPMRNALQNLTQEETNDCDISGIYIIKSENENTMYANGTKIFLKGDENALYIEQIILRSMIAPDLKEKERNVKF